MKPPPNPSLFGLEATEAICRLGKVAPPSLETPANAWYLRLAGSLRRSSQVTPTCPELLTDSQGKNSSLEAPVTRTGVPQVLPPLVEVATSTTMKEPVQV